MNLETWNALGRAHVGYLRQMCSDGCRVTPVWTFESPPFSPYHGDILLISAWRSETHNNFYRAMHMHKRSICRHAVSVCPSVCLSRSWVAPKQIFEIFSPSGSHTILVFPHQTGWWYSNGNPPNGGVECKGYEKWRFSTNILLYLRNGYS